MLKAIKTCTLSKCQANNLLQELQLDIDVQFTQKNVHNYNLNIFWYDSLGQLRRLSTHTWENEEKLIVQETPVVPQIVADCRPIQGSSWLNVSR